jgi:hypothetical protein
LGVCYRPGMRIRCFFSILLLATLPAACGQSNSSSSGGSGAGGSGGAGSAGSGGAGSSSSRGAGAGAECKIDGSSTLPGVSIAFTTTDCTYTLAEAAAGITIGYNVVVESDLQGVYPVPQDAGSCDDPNPSGLIPFAVITGGSEKYCICDSGRCPGPSGPAVAVIEGSHPGTLTWDGRNWTGPSDSDNPKGNPFPAGDYTLTVSAVGKYDDAGAKKDFNVTGTFVLHLVR